MRGEDRDSLRRTFGMYVAVAPDRSYCTGLGKTPAQARARLELAISLWFDPVTGQFRGPGSGGSPPPLV